ncbi:sensor histidine kinase [Acanthopleuribacter pedis]|uniref:Histidine kinase n=1 Tax=Acanthopleuribacter pedis TaxID=442870 RepID=A0A8J7U757_9BACT|nr:histidine kinase [Acanthopleuribacter pedis]MBO1321066.1 histidine kinase [Acanthopleuribacter pedis]
MRRLAWFWLLPMTLCLVLADEGPAPHRHDLAPVWKGSLVQSWRYLASDDPAFADPMFSDGDLPVVVADGTAVAAPEGVVWFRRDVLLEGTLGETQFLGLYLEEQPVAYELYWNGRLLDQNGRVAASREEERPGTLLGYHAIPREASSPGRHLLAVRLSCHALPDLYRLPAVEIGTLNHFRGRQTDAYYLKLINLGIWFLAFALCVALFLGGRRHAAILWFTLFCMAVMGEIIGYLWLSFFPHPITHLPWKNAFYTWLPGINAFLLHVFFLSNFNIGERRRHLAIMVAVVGVSTGLGLPLSPFWYPLGLVIWQGTQRVPGAWPAALGLAGITLYFQGFGQVLSPSYSLVLILFLFCMTLSMSLQIQARERAHRQAEMRSARLETQLLKKNIQPHFLMNTLLSIISWIEDQPSRAIAMVRALADEFRIIDRISAEPLVPLAEELELCRAHLAIMGGRKDADYQLDVVCVGEEPAVPPLLLHTLIENALTHAFAPGESGTFSLHITEEARRCLVVLANGGSLLQQSDDVLGEEGVGLRYVRARLEESFPGGWSLVYGMEAARWVVRLSFPAGVRVPRSD